MLFLGSCIAIAQNCPSLTTNPAGVVPNQIVYYSVDSSLTSAAQGTGDGAGASPTDQVQAAITAWNQANASNGTGVSFVPSTASNPPSVTFTNSTGASSPPGDVAETTTNSGLITTSNPATVTFYAGSGYFSPSSAGYSTMYLKMALHEIGHVMGMGDIVGIANMTPAQQAALPADAMNPCVGTNDIAAENPTVVPTSCDNKAVLAATNAMQLKINPPTSGGGVPPKGGGVVPVNSPPSSGGGDTVPLPCTSYETWDDTTDTVVDHEIC